MSPPFVSAPPRRALLALACLSAASAGVQAQEVSFDLKQLENNGVSAEVAAFFAKGTRFLPGTHLVGVSVNAGRRQMLPVRFDGQGAACLDAIVLAQLQVIAPVAGDAACIDLQAAYPGTRIELRPASAQMELDLPQSALVGGGGDGFERGGRAAILNYDLFTQRSWNRTGGSDYLSARLETGFNAGNWVVRSRGDYLRQQSQVRYTQQDSLVQRPLERIAAVLEAGQLAAFSEGYGGIPMLGVQLYGDDAQLQPARLTVPIEGIAQTHARVEVRQRGQVIHRSVVAPGPYRIEDIGVVGQGADLDVEIVEEDGRVQQRRVPAPMAMGNVAQPATFQLGIGRYRPYAGTTLEGQAPWLAHAGYAFDLRPGSRLSLSTLLSSRFQGAYAQTSASLGRRASAGIGLHVSNAGSLGRGHELQVQGNAAFGRGFSAGLSWQARSARFRSLEDTLLVPADPAASLPDPAQPATPWGAPPATTAQQSVGGSLSWSHPRWGTLSYAGWYSRADGAHTLGHSLSVSRRIGRASLNLTVQSSRRDGMSGFANLQVPLGAGSLSTRAYRYGNGSQVLGASYQNRTRADTRYRLEANASNDDLRLAASAGRQTAAAALHGGVSASNGGQRSAYASASGGMAVTDDGTLALSNARIGDTFAVVGIPQVPGVRLTGAGSGTSSALGTVLLPSLAPYRRSQLQLDGRTLPLNRRFGTTTVELALARGSVARPIFASQEIRQLMLTITAPDGQPARVGSALYDSSGDFLGTVIGEGNAIVDNERIGQPLFLDIAGGRCQVHYTAPTRFDPDRPYEEAAATCR